MKRKTIEEISVSEGVALEMDVLVGAAREYRLLAWSNLSEIFAHGCPNTFPPSDVC